MPRLENNGGDALARGAASFTFKPMGSSKTREEWDAMFEDFDPKEFASKPTPTDPNAVKADSYGNYEKTGSDASVQTRTASSEPATAVASE